MSNASDWDVLKPLPDCAAQVARLEAENATLRAALLQATLALDTAGRRITELEDALLKSTEALLKALDQIKTLLQAAACEDTAGPARFAGAPLDDDDTEDEA